MNLYKVLTVRDLDFVDDKGKQIVGMQLWVCGETADPGWNGWEVVKIWIPEGSVLEPQVMDLKHDDEILIEFNRKGKPAKIEVA